MGLSHLGGPRSKNQRKRKERQALGPYQKNKKQKNMEVTVIVIVIGALESVPKDLVGELEELEIRGQVETRIGQNTQKSPGDLRRLSVTWTPVKGHQ